jgi:hypothetical protein
MVYLQVKVKPMSPSKPQIGWLLAASFLLLTGLGAFAIGKAIPLTCANHPLMQCPSE